MIRDEYLKTDSVKAFIEWIAPKMDTPNSLNHSYNNKKTGMDWKCDSLYSAYEQYSWPFRRQDASTGKDDDGSGFEHTYKYLTYLSNGLKDGLCKSNVEACVKYCLLILEWGGVSNKNDTKITAKGREICKYLIAVKNRLESEMSLDKYYDSQIIMNSGFSKIYSLYIDDSTEKTSPDIPVIT